MLNFIQQIFFHFQGQFLAAVLLFVPVLKKRNKFIIRFALCLAVYFAVCYFLFNTLLYFYLRIGFFSFVYTILFVLAIGLLLVCFKTKIIEALFCACVAYGMQHCIYNVAQIFHNLIGYDWRTWQNYMTNMILCVVLFAAFYFIFVKRIKKGEPVGIDNKNIVILSVITVVVIFILSRWLESLMLGLPVYIITAMCCILLLFIQFGVFERSKLQHQAETLQHMLQFEQQQQKMKKENMDFINMKCHDLKHQISALRTGKNTPYQEKTIDELEKSIMIYDSIAKTKNEALNIVLTEKGMICEMYNIKISIIADGSKLDFMSAEDIYSLFGNALDNAIESIFPIADPDKRFISINISGKENLVAIHMENYYEAALVFENGLPQTTKFDKKYHGYGMRSIRYIVDKYGGTLAINTENNIFDLNIVFYL